MLNSADTPLRAALRHVALFANLSDAELDLVAARVREKRIERGAFFFHQGEPAENFHILKSGQVRIFQTTPEGTQVLMHFIQSGQMFGAIAAFGVKEYPASAQGDEPSSAWVWNANTMRELVAEIPALALNALEHTAQIIQQLQERVRELQTERVERRVARALLRLARQSGKRIAEGVLIDHPLSRQDLAEMTGTNLYSVSRILSAWEKQGLVSSGRERIILCVPHKLVILAEDLVPPPNK